MLCNASTRSNLSVVSIIVRASFLIVHGISTSDLVDRNSLFTSVVNENINVQSSKYPILHADFLISGWCNLVKRIPDRAYVLPR